MAVTARSYLIQNLTILHVLGLVLKLTGMVMRTHTCTCNYHTNYLQGGGVLIPLSFTTEILDSLHMCQMKKKKKTSEITHHNYIVLLMPPQKITSSMDLSINIKCYSVFVELYLLIL